MTTKSITLPTYHGGKNPATIYLDSLGSPRSAVTMHNCLDHVAQMLGQESVLDCDWGAMRRQHVQTVINKLKMKNISPATINLYLYAMKGVAREAFSNDVMPQVAYLKISLIRGLSYQRLPTGQSLTTHQCKKLLNVCDDNTLSGLRDKALLALMMGCGLRRAEITSLQMEHWDPKESAFTFIGKGNKQRKVYLPPDLEPIFDSWISVRGSTEGSIFPPIHKGQKKESIKICNMLPCSVYRIVKRRAKAAKIPTLTPHDLRRTFASRMLEAGIDLFVLQQSMGHASIAVTTRYDRRGDKAKVKAARSLHF